MSAGASAPPVVLASASPRRSAILDRLGLVHRVSPVDVPEDLRADEAPEAYVERLAREKAAAGSAAHPSALVLAGDTVVVSEDEILEKPAGPDHAVSMLLRLSGRRHRVISALALADPGGPTRSGVSRTEVQFRRIDARDARAYVGTGEPLDKAGAYGIQGRGAALVRAIDGDYYTVVGLPVRLLLELLLEAGWRYAFGALRSATPA